MIPCKWVQFLVGWQNPILYLYPWNPWPQNYRFTYTCAEHYLWMTVRNIINTLTFQKWVEVHGQDTHTRANGVINWFKVKHCLLVMSYNSAWSVMIALECTNMSVMVITSQLFFFCLESFYCLLAAIFYSPVHSLPWARLSLHKDWGGR